MIVEVDRSVKPEYENALQALRLSRSLPAKDMVEVVRAIYPKYDKTIQSKCERGAQYGIQLRKDAMDALMYSFGALEHLDAKRRKSGGHKRSCRISCRLDDATYEALQQRINREGYTNMQSWLEQQVIQYLQITSDKTKGEQL